MNKNKNAGIQVLRTMLFFGIVMFHFGIKGASFLWGGVETFFVISSFFMTKRLIGKDHSIFIWKEFWGRIKRLYPVYLIVLLMAFSGVFLAKKIIGLGEFVIHGLFLQNFYWIAKGYESLFKPLTAHTWTLGIEIWLFLIWVVAFRYIKENNARIRFNVYMIIIAVLYRTVTTVIIKDAMIISLFPLAHADAFAAGSLLALYGEKEITKKRSLYLMVVGSVLLIISIAVTASINHMTFVQGYNLYSDSKNYLNNIYTCNVYMYIVILSAGIMSLCFRISQVHTRFFKLLAWCGDYSYGAYLLHWPIRMFVLHFISGNIIVAFIVSGISIIGSFFLEKLLGKIMIKKK